MRLLFIILEILTGGFLLGISFVYIFGVVLEEFHSMLVCARIEKKKRSADLKNAIEKTQHNTNPVSTSYYNVSGVGFTTAVSWTANNLYANFRYYPNDYIANNRHDDDEE